MKSLVVAVAGTTGVGKSALALQIATHLSKFKNGACLVNSDSMQVYKGLDLVTNKPDQSERELHKHYLFDFLSAEKEYSVAQYEQEARLAIAEIHNNNQIPVVVGGTNYYVQALLLESSTIAGGGAPGLSNKTLLCHPDVPLNLRERIALLLEGTDPTSKSALDIQAFNIANSLRDTLLQVDPKMGNRWHPNDFRKIRRSLEIYFTTGKTQSQWYAEQLSASARHLRYPTLLIWLYGQPSQLDPRLDARVDQMLAKGLLAEIIEMRGLMREKLVAGLESAYTRGVLQAIGFKEFHDYFEALERGDESGPVQEKFEQGVEAMKLATRQYARQQIQWIKNKLVPGVIEGGKGVNPGAVYIIDATDPKLVTEKVLQSTFDLIDSFSRGEELKSPAILAPHLEYLLSKDTIESPSDEEVCDHDDQHELAIIYCDKCIDEKTRKPRAFNGPKIWATHIQSRAHKKQLKYSGGARPPVGDKQAWLDFNAAKKK